MLRNILKSVVSSIKLAAVASLVVLLGVTIVSLFGVELHPAFSYVPAFINVLAFGIQCIQHLEKAVRIKSNGMVEYNVTYKNKFFTEAKYTMFWYYKEVIASFLQMFLLSAVVIFPILALNNEAPVGFTSGFFLLSFLGGAVIVQIIAECVSAVLSDTRTKVVCTLSNTEDND